MSYGEEGLHSSDGNTFAISDSAFTSTANGLAIQALPTCLAQVTLTNDMFTGTSAIINQSNCLIAPEILWQNTSGEAYIWEMNGTNMIGSGSLGNPARAGTQSPPAISTAMVIPTSCGRTPAAKPTSGR